MGRNPVPLSRGTVSEPRRPNLDEDQNFKEMTALLGGVGRDFAMWQMPQRQNGLSAMLFQAWRSRGLEPRNARRIAMTRPLTKAQLAHLAVQADRQEPHDKVVRFLVRSLALGAGIGMSVAAFVLATDLFGLFGLIARQPDAISIVVSFVVGGIMLFTPLTLAVAVGLAARAK
jgi:hypothetical protein